MILTSLILAASPALVPPPISDLYAIRARRAEIGNGEVLEHAVILVEDGKIVTIGEDLPIERGIPVIDLDDEYTLMPGLVNAYSRTGLSSQGYSDSRPYIKASFEVGLGASFKSAREAGVTTLGLYPAGRGIPGQAVAVHTAGGSDPILADSVYLKAIVANNSTAKRYIRDGFEKADENAKKEAANKEKYDKAKEKAEKEKDKDKKKAALDKLGEYEPHEPDPRGQVFQDMRDKKLSALFDLDDAAGYLHLIDALGKEEIDWALRLTLSQESNFYEVAEKIGETECRVMVGPFLTLHPGTLRQRNMPAELARAGAKLVFIPRNDSTGAHQTWLRDVGTMVAAGLDRSAAIQAMTLEPAKLMGVDDRVGSIEVGKDANFLIVNGDPFETATEVEAVIIHGDVVHGEIH
tara:strand:+ start:389 stop:1609 length:1221 start_codon:yes stop_codon:yes gene_type:complete